MLVELAERVSHQQWRRIVKKERRRKIRQRVAQERDIKIQEEQSALLADPTYVVELERLERLEEEAQKLEELAAAQAKTEWELRDAALHSKFLKEKQKRIQQEEECSKQEALIKKEWEEKQRREKEEEEKKQEQQVWLLMQGKPKGSDNTHNPEPPQGYERKDVVHQKGEPCPFFTKTGACRFGVQCSREHDYPEQSRTVLFPNMYSHFGLNHLSLDSHDSDVALEYSESESYQHFKDFFEDTLPEFQKCGTVIQFKVCCNTSPHLRGNVYVQYSSEDAALKARNLFNGRWYAGKQLNCSFINLERWKSAVCGLYWRNKCPKGGQCNFLHAFRNPGNAFWRADQDFHLDKPRDLEDDSRLTHTPRPDNSVRSSRSRRNHQDLRSRSRSVSKERMQRKSNGKKERSNRYESKGRKHRRSRSRSEEPKKRHRSRSEESRNRSRRSRSKSRQSTGRSNKFRSRPKKKTKRKRSRSTESRNKSERSKRSRSQSVESE